MRCRSIGAGSAVSEFRCIRIPTGRWSRTACWAAAIERWRPMVIGSMMPGNRTVLRTGTMISASGGKGGSGPAWPALISDSPGDLVSTTEGLRFLQSDQQAAVGGGTPHRAVAPARQAHAALEPALRQLQAVDGGGAQLGRIDAGSSEHQVVAVD